MVAQGLKPMTWSSGAPRDAPAMSDHCGIAILFARWRGGIRHQPEEFANAADMSLAIEPPAEARVKLQGGGSAVSD